MVAPVELAPRHRSPRAPGPPGRPAGGDRLQPLLRGRTAEAPILARVRRLAEPLIQDQEPVIVLTFGYPQRPRDPQARSTEEWVARADRKPFEQVMRRFRETGPPRPDANAPIDAVRS